MNVKTLARVVSLIAVLIVIAGCRSTGVKNRLGQVSGKVTLGGQPLADALVMFSGIPGGSPSAGRTYSSGNYTLVFTKGVNGAEVGPHTVIISTLTPLVKTNVKFPLLSVRPAEGDPPGIPEN